MDMIRNLLLVLCLSIGMLYASAQDTSKIRSLEVYGFVMTDMGYNNHTDQSELV